MNNWIVVNDRVPHLKDASVLAHFSTGSIETVHIEDYFRPDKTGITFNEISNPKITHWMELPEPPKI